METPPQNRFVEKKLPSLLLALMMFCTGACGFVSECLLSTVSTYILGNSIEQFSVIIALMMLMMGVGGVAQRLISDSLLIEKFIIAEICLALLGGYAALGIFAAYGYLENHFEVVLYFVASLIGFLIGLELPLALRINERYADHLSGNLSHIFALDYVGSFIGALLWTKYLLRVFPLTEIGFLLGGINLLVAAVAFAYFVWQKRVERYRGIVILLSIAALILVVGYRSNRQWNSSIEQRLYEAPIVWQETTRYQRIVLTHSRSLDEYRLYLNGNLQFSSVDEKRYHELLVHPALATAPRRQRVLVLGGGDGLALREILKYRDVEHVTLVDLDPAIIRLASTHAVFRQLNNDAFVDARVHPTLSEGVRSTGRQRAIYQETEEWIKTRNGKMRRAMQEVARVEIWTVDADRFIAKTREKWDAVIIDLPDPNSIELAKLYSREFYAKVRRLLAPHGVVAAQATSPYHAKETYLCMKRTLEAAGFQTLPYHTNVPSFGDWGWFLAWQPQAPSPAAKIASLKQFPVATSYLTPELLRASLAFGKDDLVAQHREVSSLMRPVILDYYLREGWKVE